MSHPDTHDAPLSERKPVRRDAYTPFGFSIEQIELQFDLDSDSTLVKQKSTWVRKDPLCQDLVLDGIQLELIELDISGMNPSEIKTTLTESNLTLHSPPDRFELLIENRIHPSQNSALEGLYASNNMLCTQCEANGFRRITWFADRPDVLTRYRVILRGDKTRFPIMLANGNPVESGELPNNQHYTIWEDPFAKPCYLFALVAGDLHCHQDSFVTASGQEKSLQIYVEHENRGLTEHAMNSIKKAMQWDEQTFGLEYDLERFMVVAVNDFNMGAMENKGLNVFNAKYVLASQQTATDTDYENIESVIAHEYFHNWTGNRVTCRDWFQLSLKEGLTVFRDQEFTADMGSATVKRIKDVKVLRAHQFQEDSGPNAHPVRPEAYLEMNNLYTVTVYNKGAEVVRMYQTLLGKTGFRKGMDLYFQRHDGCAVTCDDFRQAMADANQTSLDQFERWYSQSGTPVVSVTDSFDPDTHTYTLTLEQTCPPTPGQTEKQPFHIPFAIGLITPMGHNLQLFRDPDSGEPCSTTVLNFTEAKQSWSFSRITDKPVLSLLRNFSAPVKLNYAYTDEQLAFLMRYDENDFCRWEAGQELAIRTIMNVCDQLKQGEDAEVSELLIDGFETILNDTSNDKAFRTLALTLPSETELLEKMLPEETDLIFKARETVRLALAERLEEGFFSKYQSNLESASRYSHDHESVGRRSLKNLCLGYLVALEQEMYIDLCVKQFERANNMTDQLSALAMLSHTDHHARDACLSLFYNQWQKDPLVVDKWLAIQAQARRRDTLSCVRSLMQHPAFTLRNPNRVRALIGSFAQANPSLFHHKTGEGYQFLTDQIIELDRINPQIAARMVVPLIDWKKFDRRRQVLMREQLQRLYDSQSLSPNTFELVSKALIKTQC